MMDLLERLNHQNRHHRPGTLFDAFNREVYATPLTIPNLPDGLSWLYKYAEDSEGNRHLIKDPTVFLNTEARELNMALESSIFESMRYKFPASVLIEIGFDGETLTYDLSEGDTDLIEVGELQSIKITIDPETEYTDSIGVHTMTLRWTSIGTQFMGVLDVIGAKYGTEFPADLKGADIDYILNHAAHKQPSTYLTSILDQYGSDLDDHRVITVEGVEILADNIWKRFGRSWMRIYETLMEDYQPLSNYDMEEEETPDISKKYRASDDYALKTNKKTNTNLTTEDEGSDVEGSRYGFNSTSAVPTDKTHTSGTVTVSGDEESNYEDTTETQEGYREETETGKRSLKRSGNIGVTTSQQMAQAELELRIKEQLRPIIYHSLDEVLTIGNYLPVVSDKIYFSIGG